MDVEDSGFLPSGHSHNELDQQFSTVAGVILSAPVLEHMEELCRVDAQGGGPSAG